MPPYKLTLLDAAKFAFVESLIYSTSYLLAFFAAHYAIEMKLPGMLCLYFSVPVMLFLLGIYCKLQTPALNEKPKFSLPGAAYAVKVYAVFGVCVGVLAALIF